MPRVESEVSSGQVVIPVGVFKDDPSPADAARPPEINRYNALVDTGATHTAVTPQLMKNLALEERDSGHTVQTPRDSEPQTCTECDIYLSIPVTPAAPNAAKKTLQKKWLTAFLIADQPVFDVLLGMDVIADCSFFCDGREFVLVYPPRPFLHRIVKRLAW